MQLLLVYTVAYSFVRCDDGSNATYVFTDNMESEDKIISLRIFMPEDLKNEFKAVCARQGANMSEVVVKFVKGYVEEYGFSLPPRDKTPEPEPAAKPTAAAKATAKAKGGRGKN
ncbi:hypothetical protein [Microcoleus sp. T3_D1]|uniref:hypothetical protein n=1 Tax=Microcoleus sp. T3_D1 TaxID=3055427 RepID=UPI002FCF890C